MKAKAMCMARNGQALHARRAPVPMGRLAAPPSPAHPFLVAEGSWSTSLKESAVPNAWALVSPAPLMAKCFGMVRSGTSASAPNVSAGMGQLNASQPNVSQCCAARMKLWLCLLENVAQSAFQNPVPYLEKCMSMVSSGRRIPALPVYVTEGQQSVLNRTAPRVPVRRIRTKCSVLGNVARSAFLPKEAACTKAPSGITTRCGMALAVNFVRVMEDKSLVGMERVPKWSAPWLKN